MDIVEILRSKGISFEIQEDEIISVCPKCKKKKLWYNKKKEKWKCWTCGIGGRKFSFFRLIDFKYKLPLILHKGKVATIPDQVVCEAYEQDIDPRVYKYLTEDRKFSVEVIKRFRLGSRVFNGRPQWTIPHIECGIVVNVKYRDIPPSPKRFMRWPGAKSCLYNIENCKNKDMLIIVEGEADVIAMKEYGYDACSSSTGAEGGFEDTWRAEIGSYGVIILLYDADEVGGSGRNKLANQLTTSKVLIATMPPGCKDINDCLKIGISKEVIDSILEKSQIYEPPGTGHISCYSMEIVKSLEQKKHGLPIPIVHMDNLLRGWQPGQVTIVTGHSGKGKTTFVNFCMNFLIEKGYSVCLGSFEMTKEQIFLKLAATYFKKDRFSLTSAELNEYREHLDRLPLQYIDRLGKIRLEDLSPIIRHSVMKNGSGLVILDNFGFISSGEDTHKVQENEHIIWELKSLSMELKTHILVICHPNKQTASSDFVDLTDLKGASAIYQCADNVISLKRDVTGKPWVHFWCAKVRDGANMSPFWRLWFDSVSLIYRDKE